MAADGVIDAETSVRTVAALAELRELVGDELLIDQVARNAARTDKSGAVAAGMPAAVLRARSVASVQAALRVATAHGLAVVPRGAGTGLAGGGAAGAGTLVVDVSALDRILDLDPDDEIAVVQPGVLNAALSAAAAPHGLFFAPDPASKAISTIGGNIATNAGGLLCAKYGVTREAVLGLAVVLPDGRLIRTGRRTVKGVAGYDLTALFVGSEGTLGIVVEATVRLTPLPTVPPVTLAAFFPTIAAAAGAAAGITAARLRPAVLELADARATAAIRGFVGDAALAAFPGVAPGDAFLLAQFDGTGAEGPADAAAGILAAAGGIVRREVDPERGEALLALRRAFHPALEARGTVLIEDVCVPRSALRAMFAEIEKIERATGLEIPTVAHAGDGNLHPNFVLPNGATEPDETVWAAAEELFLAALRLGGTLTGEHGVGRLKRRWLGAELGADVLALQRQVQAVFDPTGIMNPGAVFA